MMTMSHCPLAGTRRTNSSPRFLSAPPRLRVNLFADSLSVVHLCLIRGYCSIVPLGSVIFVFSAVNFPLPFLFRF